MNVKNNKGYTGTDLVISMLIITIFIPTIVSLMAAISTTGGEKEKKAYAVSVATNVLEIAKASNIDCMNSIYLINDPDEENYNDFYKNLCDKNYSNIINDNNLLKWNLTDENENIYEIYAYIQDYQELNNNANNNIVKKITVTVKYRVNNNIKQIEISTLKTKE